jgi:hypothetical protein
MPHRVPPDTVQFIRYLQPITTLAQAMRGDLLACAEAVSRTIRA